MPDTPPAANMGHPRPLVRVLRAHITDNDILVIVYLEGELQRSAYIRLN